MMLLPQGPNFLILWCFNNEAVLDSPAEAVMFEWPLSSACFCATKLKAPQRISLELMGVRLVNDYLYVMCDS